MAYLNKVISVVSLVLNQPVPAKPLKVTHWMLFTCSTAQAPKTLLVSVIGKQTPCLCFMPAAEHQLSTPSHYPAQVPLLTLVPPLLTMHTPPPFQQQHRLWQAWSQRTPTCSFRCWPRLHAWDRQQMQCR